MSDQSKNNYKVLVHPVACGLGYAFLIENHKGMYLVDCGSPNQEDKVLAKMQALNRNDLKVIWITHAHYDHYGSAAALRTITGAKIGVHPADAEYLRRGQSPLGSYRAYGAFLRIGQQIANARQPLKAVNPDFCREDDGSLQAFGLEATVLHTPGHTPGHACLLLQNGVAFAGDLIGRARKPHRQALLATNWTALDASLERLRAYKPEWIYVGHSPKPISGRVLKDI